MAHKNNTKTLFEKYLNNTISKKEYMDFMKRLSDPDNRSEVEGLMEKLWKDTAEMYKEQRHTHGRNEQLRFKGITDCIDLDRDSKRNTTKTALGNTVIFKIAAVFVLFVLSALWFTERQILPFTSQAVDKPGQPEAVTLTLGNGNVKVIFANAEHPIMNGQGKVVATQKGNRLDYNSEGHRNKGTSNEVVYNEVYVPYANHFDIGLSDGTLVKLNAGSWIKYPTAFGNDGPREVFLKGEAYFEVAENPERPFVVNAGDIHVRALGTEFNVTYYPEDEEINTVLVNGSVEIAPLCSTDSAIGQATLLRPGEKGAWHKQNQKLAVEPVNIDLYTAWKDGVLLFRKTSFNTIRRKLERRFDVNIKNDYAFLEEQVYTATFRKEGISEILNAFKSDTPFEYDYDVTTNTITLTQKQ